MHTKTTKISSVILFILIFPFIEPQLFKAPEYAVFDSFFSIFKFFAALCIILIYLCYFHFKFSFPVICACILQGWIFIATIIKDGSISTFAGPALTMVAVFMLVEIALHNNYIKFLTLICNLLSLYIILNFLTYILLVYDLLPLPYAFLGMDNRWIYFILPWIILNFFLSLKKNGRISISAWGAWWIGFISLVFVWSAGAMVAVGLFAVLWLLGSKAHLFKKTIVSLSFILVVACNFLLTNDLILSYYRNLITNFFHKDITLAGRIYLWRTVYQILQSSPLYGTGVMTSDESINLFYTSSGFVDACRVNHPHNFFLYFAFRGGWCALAIFIVIIWKIFHELKKYACTLISCCLWCGVCAFLTAALIDTMDFSLIYIIFALCVNIKYIYRFSKMELV